MHVYRLRTAIALILICGGLLAAMVALPGLAERLLGGALVLTAAALLVLTLLRISPFIPARRPRRARELQMASELPYVSVHMVVGSNPPEVVRRALDSLTRLNYPEDRCEVVVLDSRHEESETANSLEHHCHQLGSRFRYVTGADDATKAKATLLNHARRIMAPEATVIAVVDADVEVAPHFLRIAVAALDSREISHVQFPQAHRSADGGRELVATELRHYYNFYARSAGTGMLLTGSLSVIRRDALAEVGGWEDGSFAHETNLGTRLLAAGFHGRYVDLEAGKSLLPLSFSDLATLRFRRAAGDARCLVDTCRFGRIPRTGIGNFWRMLQQLSAWLDLQAVALGLAVAAAIGSILSGHVGPFPEFFALAMVMWALAALAGALPVALATKDGLAKRLRACLIHQSLAPEASWGTIRGLFGRRLPSIRFLTDHYGPTPARAASASPLLASALLLPHDTLIPLACLGAVFFLQITLRRYTSIKLIAGPEQRPDLEHAQTQRQRLLPGRWRHAAGTPPPAQV